MNYWKLVSFYAKIVVCIGLFLGLTGCAELLEDPEVVEALITAFDVKGCITWKFQSAYPYKVYLEFYSQDKGNWVWPGGGEVYVLKDYYVHTFTTCGNYGEKVCYGAWTSFVHWGVGKDDKYGCKNCCAYSKDIVKDVTILY